MTRADATGNRDHAPRQNLSSGNRRSTERFVNAEPARQSIWSRVQALNGRILQDLDRIDGGGAAGKAATELVGHVRDLLARTRGFDERKVMVGRREGIPPTLLRDLDALASFGRSLPSAHTRDLRLRYWIKTAAVLFSAGFRDAGRDIVEAMGNVHCALMLAEHFCGYHQAGDLAFSVSGNVSFLIESFFGCWFKVGLPRIRLTRNEAAALALTEIPRDVAGDVLVHAPWPHVLLELPDGVLPWRDGDQERSIEWVMLHRVTEPEPGERCGVHVVMCAAGDDIFCGADLYDETEEAARRDAELGGGLFCRSGARELAPGDLRVLRLASRIAMGACAALTNAQAEGRIKARCAPASRVGGMPGTTDVRLGLPVKADFSEAVAEYALGRKTVARKSQWVVRGHWREQACGPGWTQHRRIWVQPFWKGPAHLPVLVRPHVGLVEEQR